MADKLTFKNLKENAGYTSEYVARKLGVKVETYRKYECFNRLPSTNILTQMVGIYNCTFEEILKAYENAKGVQIERYGKTNP